jgi:hypothetical protein
MNPTVFKKPKLNRKERDINTLENTEQGINFKQHMLAVNSTQKQKTPFRDDDRSVHLEDEIARNVQVSNFDDMNLKFEALKKQVMDNVNREREKKKAREQQLLNEKESGLPLKEDSFLQTTQERGRRNQEKAELENIQNQLGDYDTENQDADPKEVTGLESALVDEDDIEIIDDSDINFALDGTNAQN